VTVDSRHGFVFADRALAPDGGLDAYALDAVLLDAIDTAIGSNDVLPVGYTTEIGLAASGFIAAVADRLTKGVAIFIDYGFPRREYYHPQRHTGTLMMHYRHHAHADPFLRPGLTDITAHVDFSAASSAALRPGAELLGYASQANFLINCRIADLASASFASSAENPAAWAVQASALQKLLSEAEMGELFKVIAFGRKIDEPLIGFSRGDRSGSL
jgi:SAM-dependent MidA family methyltransferase